MEAKRQLFWSHRQNKFRYFKFTTYECWSIGSDISKQKQWQLSRIEFIVDDQQLDIEPTLISWPGFADGVDDDDPSSSQGWSKMFDHKTSTKLCYPITAFPNSLVFDLGESGFLQFKESLKWQWWYANDSAETWGEQTVRNPWSFSMSLSEDNETWLELDKQVRYPLVLANYELAYEGILI